MVSMGASLYVPVEVPYQMHTQFFIALPLDWVQRGGER